MAEPIPNNTGNGPQPGAPGNEAPATIPPPDLSVNPNGDPQELVEQANRMIAWLQAQSPAIEAEISAAAATQTAAEATYDDATIAAAAKRYGLALAARTANAAAIQQWGDNQRQAWEVKQAAGGKTLTQEQRDLITAQGKYQNALMAKTTLEIESAKAAASNQPLSTALANSLATAQADAERLKNDWQTIQNAGAQAQAPYVGPQAAAKTQNDQATADLNTANADVANRTRDIAVAAAQYGADSAQAKAAQDALNVALDTQFSARERQQTLDQGAATVTGTGLQNTGTGIANQQSQFTLDQSKQYTPQLNQQAVDAGRLTNQASTLKLRQDQLGTAGTLVDQAQEAVRQKTMTPEAATQWVFSQLYGETPAQRQNQATTNAQNVLQTATNAGMVVPQGQQYLSPGAAPGGDYQQGFARAGVKYTPMRIDQGAAPLPAFAAQMQIPTTPAQPQGNWFDAQGNVLPAFAQGLSGAMLGPNGGLMVTPQAARAMIAASQPQVRAA